MKERISAAKTGKSAICQEHKFRMLLFLNNNKTTKIIKTIVCQVDPIYRNIFDLKTILIKLGIFKKTLSPFRPGPYGSNSYIVAAAATLKMV